MEPPLVAQTLAQHHPHLHMPGGLLGTQQAAGYGGRHIMGGNAPIVGLQPFANAAGYLALASQ